MRLVSCLERVQVVAYQALIIGYMPKAAVGLLPSLLHGLAVHILLLRSHAHVADLVPVHTWYTVLLRVACEALRVFGGAVTTLLQKVVVLSLGVYEPLLVHQDVLVRAQLADLVVTVGKGDVPGCDVQRHAAAELTLGCGHVLVGRQVGQVARTAHANAPLDILR